MYKDIKFMPNIRIKLDDDDSYPSEVVEKLNNIFPTYKYGDIFYVIGKDGAVLEKGGTPYTFFLYQNFLRLVSVFEAIPELVPEGMRYSKEFNKLVPDIAEDGFKEMSGGDWADIASRDSHQNFENKYDRTVVCKDCGEVFVADVYSILKAFKVECPALQHLIKKALCSGLRGHKNKETDLQDIIDSAIRAKELYMEDKIDN